MKEKQIREAVKKALEQLRKSERGQRALNQLEVLIKNDAAGFDSENWAAFCVLVLAAKEGLYHP